jgi:hypothetical protein
MLPGHHILNCSFAENLNKMKAAVIFQKDEAPKYVEDFAEPEVQNENALLISVKASAL